MNECQCPKCGRLHKSLQAGTPPPAIVTPASEIEAIRKRLEAATPGPWLMFPHKPTPEHKAAVVAFDAEPPCLNSAAIYGHPEAMNKNATFIVNAPTDIRFLLDHIAALEVEHARDLSAIKNMQARETALEAKLREVEGKPPKP